MGTKHTSSGPKGAKRRRKAVAAVRSFPEGCCPPNNHIPEPSDSEPEEFPAAGYGPSPEMLASEQRTEKMEPLKEKVVSNAGEEPLAVKMRDFAKRGRVSAVRDFPQGCGISDRRWDKGDGYDTPATAEKPPKSSIGNDDAKVKVNDGSNSQEELTFEAGTAGEESIAGGPVAEKKLDGKGKKQSLMGSKSDSGVKILEKEAGQASMGSLKVSEKGKRNLAGDQEQGGGIGAGKQSEKQGGVGASQVPEKKVLIQGLMAACNCPWMNKKRVARDKSGNELRVGRKG